MISSITSKNKDVISLTPVQIMSSAELSKLMLQVITNVTNAGLRIVSIISDNNVVNRKSFMLISGSDTLRPYIMNPVKPSQNIFILFDTVHLLKCVRNNWLNLRNEKTNICFSGYV